MSASAVVSSTARDAAPSANRRLPVGAEYIGDGQTHVRVWAPRATRIQVVTASAAPVALERDARGYVSGLVSAGPGDRYQFRLDDDERLYPDPASRFQPDGPHGASEVIDPRAFRWTDDAWKGVTLE